MNFYNDNDPRSAAWIQNLIDDGLLAPGVVCGKNVKELIDYDFEGFRQCHFFAGIGGWPHALDLAGWPRSRPVWTASLPCQPFSDAGKQRGFDDDRHLWPVFIGIVRKHRPNTIFGEQVRGAIGKGWLDGVFTDLEAEGYACGAVVLGAHSVGSPHQRQRVFWVADLECNGRHPRRGRSGETEAARKSGSEFEPDGQLFDLADPRGQGLEVRSEQSARQEFETVERGGNAGAMGDPNGARRQQREPATKTTRHGHPIEPASGLDSVEHAAGDGREQRRAEPAGRGVIGGCGDGGALGNAGRSERRAVGETRGIEGVDLLQQREKSSDRLGGASASGAVADSSIDGYAEHELEPGRRSDASQEHASECSGLGFWDRFEIVHCTDGKARRFEPGSFPLAHGIPDRVGLLRGYGNAIVPQVAAVFIQEFMNLKNERNKG